MSATWSTEPERGSPAAVQLVAWLALKAGRTATRWLLYPLALYFLAFAPRARRASRAFLDRALGRKARIADLLRNFHAFAATLHDRVYLLSGRFDELDIGVEGAAALEAVLAQGRGCILLGSHLGSFEAARALARRLVRHPISIVMHKGVTRNTDAVLDRLAPDLKARVIAPGRPETMLRIRECLERGEIVGILGDRPFGSEKVARCPFLGVPAQFPHGPFRLALTLQAPVVLFFGLYEGGNRYRIHLEVLAAAPAAASAERAEAARYWLESYVARLEHYARAAPYNWFNFYDFWGEGVR